MAEILAEIQWGSDIDFADSSDSESGEGSEEERMLRMDPVHE